MPATASTGIGLPATEIATKVRGGELDAVEVVRAHLDRIAQLDPRVGAFQRVLADRALADAARLRARPGFSSFPLAGVPVAVKDNVPVAGEPMRVGTRATPDAPSAEDHPVVQRLRDAGAVIVGITRVPELCLWPWTDGAMGTARNPWDLRRTAGGSSGGSAAAVAAGMVPIAHGNDGLGSIRIPAAACGLVGIKPGRGVVPSALGADSWYGMAENGALATTVSDAALLLSVLAADPSLARVEPPPRRLRIALATAAPTPGLRVDHEFVRATERAARALADAGHDVADDAPRVTTRHVAAIMARWMGGTARDTALLGDAQRTLEVRTRHQAAAGRLVNRLGMVRERDAEAWRAMQGEFFASYDLLLTPSLARTAVKADGWSRRGWLRNAWSAVRFAPFAGAWNYAGFPALNVPAGLHPDGLPLGVQLVAAPGGEGMLLSAARQLEALLPWPRTAPLA
jgi:amidase